MKILHVLFDDYPYISDWGYQENKLAYYQSSNHDVYIVTANYVPKILEEFVDGKALQSYEEYKSKDHNMIKIYRLKCLFGNFTIAKKIKFYKGLYKKIDEIKPDIIFIHDLHALSLFSVTKYIKKNKNVICNADIHVNDVNSCNSILAKILHKFYYRLIIQINIKYINNLFYLNNNSKSFLKKMYGIDEKKCKLLLLPLGGEVTTENEILKYQKKFRKINDISKDSIIFVHSGKFTKNKKTIELLKSFLDIRDTRFYLYLIGQPCKEIEKDFFNLVAKDERIIYIGWKSNSELMKYLKVCDIYLQPGSPSVTAHEAMCNKCAVLLSSNGEFYKSFVPNDSAYYIHDNMELKKFFKEISKNNIDIEMYKNNSYELAKNIFDYKMQSELIIK